jgi:hypothetical protein
MRLFNRDVAEGKESTEEHRYNRPHEPRPSNPSCTVKKVRHKDVRRPAVRNVVNVGPKFTRILLRLLNLQRPTRTSNMPQRHPRLRGWNLAKGYPQPCVHDDTHQGEWLRSNHAARQLAHRQSSRTTQTPRFSLPEAVTPPGRTPSAPRTEAPSPPRKKAKTQKTPSANVAAMRRTMQYEEEKRRPMTPRAKQERRQVDKGKLVLNPQFENRGLNRRDRDQAAAVRHHSSREGEGPSTAHPRETHRCSFCNKLGHYGTLAPFGSLCRSRSPGHQSLAQPGHQSPVPPAPDKKLPRKWQPRKQLVTHVHNQKCNLLRLNGHEGLILERRAGRSTKATTTVVWT